MNTIEQDAAAQHFLIEVDGHRALLEYQLTDAVMTITHTRVPAAIGGRGIAAELTRAALEYAHSAHWKVVPACSYAVEYMKRHPDPTARQHSEDLLDEALQESFPASDPPSVGASS